MMRQTAESTGLPIRIYGPETHITAVVPLALGLAKYEDFPEYDDEAHHVRPKKVKSGKAAASSMSDAEKGGASDGPSLGNRRGSLIPQKADHEADHSVENFTAMTRCVVYGLQHRAVQGMLDFDKMCKRAKPSVACMIFPFAASHFIKFYWGTEEILIPVYQTMKEAMEKNPEASVMVNFASFRSVYESTMEVLQYDNIKTIAVSTATEAMLRCDASLDS